MVVNDNSQNSISDDDVPMTSLSPDVMSELNSSPRVHCPHCDFLCYSSSIMTQHSWEVHPLLMRQKKHLIRSSNTSSVEPICTTATKMQKCTLSNNGIQTESERHTNPFVQLPSNHPPPPTQFAKNDAARSLSLLSSAAAFLDASSNYSPQRHVAVVNPVLVETQRQEIVPQPFMMPQQINNNQFVYTPMYNAYIPSLNQFVAIPIAPGVFSTAVPTQGMLNTSIENALKNYLNTQQKQTAEIMASLPQSLPYLQPQIAPIVTKQQQQQSMQNGVSFNRDLDSKANEIRTLLQANTIGQNIEPSIMYPQNRINRINPNQVKIERSDTNTTPVCATFDKERQRKLENALLSTDCCDINDTSTTMPFKCPDGVWRMVTFKCIRGVWLVQVPGTSIPTVYLPCDADEVAKKIPAQHRSVKAISQTCGHKRKLSDSIGSSTVTEIKRLCASAPIPGATVGSLTNKAPLLQRTRSDPALPAPCRHFTNNEGKTVNISMIQRNPTQNKSCNLIKSLLLRKPVTHSNVASSNNLSMTSPTGRMQCKPKSTQKLVTSLNRPAPLSTNSMAY